MKTILLNLFCLCVLLISCNGQTAIAVKTIDAKVFDNTLKTTKKPQLIDVRTTDEFAEQHLLNAVNINWNGDDFEKQSATLNKTKPVFVYCKAGGRSAKAANKLAEMGFTTIYNLDGGITKWNLENLPITK